MSRKNKDFAVVGVCFIVCFIISGIFFSMIFDFVVSKKWSELNASLFCFLLYAFGAGYSFFGLKEIIKVDA